MPDAHFAAEGLSIEARPRIALAEVAFKRAKRRFGARTDEELAKAMGLTPAVLYRLKFGITDIHLSRAFAIAEQIGLPVGKTFTANPDQQMKKVKKVA